MDYNKNIANFDRLIRKFFQIKEMGWIKSIQKGNGGIGRTFENLLGIEANGLEIPDFQGIEIKTRRLEAKSLICLFSASPTGPHYHEIEVLRDKYGYIRKNDTYRIFNGTISANKLTNIGKNHLFKIIVDREQEKLFLAVYDNLGYLIEKETYWDFDILKEKLERKFHYLALITAISRKNNNKEESFKYFLMELYKLRNFDNFISLIEDGTIKVLFKINVYRGEYRHGCIHDNGTSFEISEGDLDKLFIKILQKG